MIVIVLLALVQLSCAAVPMMRSIMDPQIIAIDDVEGFLYDVPEYEDPLVMQHQLSSIGAMPIFTLLESAKKRGTSKIDDFPEKVKIEESKKAIDEIMSRIELARAKLEKGNGNIHADVEKVIQSLKVLEKSVRPDIRQVLNSLQSIMTMARPIMIPEIKELSATKEPDSYEKTAVLEKPKSFDRQALSVRVATDDKPESEEKPELKDSFNSSQSMSAEKSVEEERVAEERSKSFESLEISKESYEATRPPFEFKMKERKNTNFDGEDGSSSYKAKLTWKAAGVA